MIEPFSELTHAREALAVGDKRTASDILMNLVRREPSSIEAWLLLSQAMEAIEQRRDCVRQALRLDPDNQAAHAELAAIEHLAANPPPPRVSRRAAAAQKAPVAPAAPPAEAPARAVTRAGGASSPAAASPLKSIGYGLAGGLLVGLILMALIWWLHKPAAPTVPSTTAPGGIVLIQPNRQAIPPAAWPGGSPERLGPPDAERPSQSIN